MVTAGLLSQHAPDRRLKLQHQWINLSLTKAIEAQQAAMLSQLGVWYRSLRSKPGVRQDHRKQAQQTAAQAKRNMMQAFKEQTRLVNQALDIDDRLAAITAE